jgi:hypothetical protein
MAQEDQLDEALQQLRQIVANLATMTNIVIGLRQNTERLLGPLQSALEEARDAINTTLRALRAEGQG